jgi:NAD-dependent deacetylase
MNEYPREMIERLKRAKKVAVLTGAGVSAESGVPTFRGEEGLWSKFRPEELATVEAFMRNPELVWEWYQHRRELMSNVKPNPGHYALAEMEKYFEEFTLITQNIDGFHRLAGSENVLELHGNIRKNKCFECSKPFEGEIDLESRELAKCECGGNIRPDVVWFGEMLPERALTGAFDAASQADVFFSIGTSALVHPAASIPIAARRNGAVLVEINLDPTPLSDFADYSIRGKSGEILPRIMAELNS